MEIKIGGLSVEEQSAVMRFKGALERAHFMAKAYYENIVLASENVDKARGELQDLGFDVRHPGPLPYFFGRGDQFKAIDVRPAEGTEIVRESKVTFGAPGRSDDDLGEELPGAHLGRGQIMGVEVDGGMYVGGVAYPPEDPPIEWKFETGTKSDLLLGGQWPIILEKMPAIDTAARLIDEYRRADPKPTQILFEGYSESFHLCLAKGLPVWFIDAVASPAEEAVRHTEPDDDGPRVPRRPGDDSLLDEKSRERNRVVDGIKRGPGPVPRNPDFGKS